MSPSGRSHFVFLDPTGKRWPRMRLVIVFLFIVLLAALLIFIHSIWIAPRLKLPPHITELKDQLRSQDNPSPLTPYQPKNLWLEFYKKTPAGQKRIASLHRKLAASKPDVTLGFYVPWDPNSLASLRKNAPSLTHVAVEWFVLKSERTVIVEEIDATVKDFLQSTGVGFLPMMTNLVGTSWQPEPIEALLMGPQERRDHFVQETLSRVNQLQAAGLLVDWQQIDPAYRNALTALLMQLAEALHGADREFWLSVPVGHDLRPFDLDAISAFTDHFVGTLHDENSDLDEAGPIASMDWFEGWLKALLAYGEPQQWVISLGSYGYDWGSRPGLQAESLSFADVMSLAHNAEVAKIEGGPPTLNPNFQYRENDVAHQVWFLDAVTFLNQARAVRAFGVTGIGLYRLGTEDPLVWEALRQSRNSQMDFSALRVLQSGETISHLGRGEFITVDVTQKPGLREVQADAFGRLQSKYITYPQYPVVFHQGGENPDLVALTFDDGPDEKWTPQVLEILKERKVPAAFFVVGNKAEESPDLVRRIYQEGHEIGNHTYTHPNLNLVTDEHMMLELNATQRLLEFILGHSTLLFRPPYQADARPKDLEDLRPIAIAESLGYLTVCEKIDPEDWQQPTAEKLLERIKEKRRLGNIVLLHDAGGNRSQTIKALPALIDWLRARGDTIVPLSTLIGTPRDQLMPVQVESSEETPRWVSGFGFRALHLLEELAWSFMILATILLLIRTLIVAALAKRHPAQRGLDPSYHEPLTILLPAHNEEKVIVNTITALLRSEGVPEFEILVIDDGSRDQTRAMVEENFGKNSRVRLICQANQGKAAALQRGLHEALHGLLITLDADTQFQPDTIRFLLEPMRDPDVVAVSGHVKVGNPRTVLTRCQALEYTCGFNLDRRAYDQLNAITVIPGAACALRKSAVMAAGGFTHDTLAEDTDLTLNLHRLGGKITYAPRAFAWTEAPETIAELLKQRFRWCFGTMQCLWKHRDLLFSPKMGALGWFSLPGIWFFQMLLVALIPAVDLLLIFSLLVGSGSAILPFFILFLAVDLLLAWLACYLEEEPLWNALWIIPMRFIYRPLLAWVVWKSLSRAFRGVWVTWIRVERTGSVDLPEA